MKFAVVSDIHFGPDGYSNRGDLRKLASFSKELVDKFVSEMNESVHPSFVVQLGDVIEDDTPEEDRKNFKYALGFLENLNCPLHHVVGNHDTKKLSEEEVRELTSQKQLYGSFDSNGYHFIILFSKRNEGGDITIGDPQLKWLADDLAHTGAKTVVFVHHSLADQDLSGNYWFEGLPEHALIGNREQVRKVLEDSGKVVGVINGHLHWNNMNVHSGIPYFNIQSLVENFRGDGTPSASYAIVDLNYDGIKVEVVGNDSAKYEFNFQP